MNRPMHIAACSGGKDSVATILLAAQYGDPLDEVVFSEVMFDQNTTGEVPEHRDFIYDRLKPFCEKELGVKFTILHGPKPMMTSFITLSSVDLMREKSEALRGLECALRTESVKPIP